MRRTYLSLHGGSGGPRRRRGGVKTVEGTVVFKSSRNIRVETPEGELLCSMRGRFRAAPNRVVAGDRVRVTRLQPGDGVLEEILPRRSEMRRASAGGKIVLVAANVDQLLIVLSAREPAPRWALVDRMLVAAECDGIEPIICLNKWDQVEDSPEERRTLEDVLAMYRALGFPAHALSAVRGAGLESLVGWLRGKTTALSGHSGVGKTTLLNKLYPGLDLATREVNVVTGKGRHATTAVRLLKLPFGGYAVDTPGFREFQPVGLPRAELGRHYPEFREHVGRCRFNDCLHREEPQCAVRSAVEGGLIPKMRYDNYLQILSSLSDAPQS